MEDDGKLVELTASKKSKSKRRAPEDCTEQERKEFFAELKAYAIMHEYKPGWAAVKYKDKFKAWPPRHFDSVEPAKVLSPTVALWVRSQNIKWAKSKHNTEAKNAGA